MNSDFSDFIRFFPIFRLFPTFRLLDSTTLLSTLAHVHSLKKEEGGNVPKFEAYSLHSPHFDQLFRTMVPSVLSTQRTPSCIVEHDRAKWSP